MDRELVVAAARTWAGTPYHHLAKVKGAGVDCGQLVIAAFEEAGAIQESPSPEFYTCDWHLHRNEDKYIDTVEKVLTRRFGDDERSIDQRLLEDASFALPAGEVIVFRVGRTFSHGGIVTQWPQFIHSYLPSGIVEEVDIRNTPMSARPSRVYTFEGYDR
jgi:cell wall-associated NlpC family hydrolase